jgi:hypothetical protein
LAGAAAPAGALDALVVVFVVAALLIAPSPGVLYRIDQCSRLVGYGLGSDVENGSAPASGPGGGIG